MPEDRFRPNANGREVAFRGLHYATEISHASKPVSASYDIDILKF